jgi:hypothetical protein
MSQSSRYLHREQGRYQHWCPACEEMHHLPDSWSFNGNVDKPTFTPSFLNRGLRRTFVNGQWVGDWIRDSDGNPIPFICHYILTDGTLNYCGDCTHAMAGKSMPLPELPVALQAPNPKEGQSDGNE